MSLYLISFIIFIINPAAQSQICDTQSSVSGVISVLKDNDNSFNECHYVGQKNNLIIPYKNPSWKYCKNDFASKLLRVSGNWPIDLGSESNWNAAEPLGLMTYNNLTCEYILILKGLPPKKIYSWKVIFVLNNKFLILHIIKNTLFQN